MTWQIRFHPKVLEEIQELPEDIQAKLARTLEMMKAISPLEMREPHVKSLGKKLWEIRLKGRDRIARVFYIILTKKQVVLLRAFVKKTQKTPKCELKCVQERRMEILLPGVNDYEND